MPEPISGIHHITAIASDPQRNLDFYSGFLGLRLVKRTVNFDDPGTYHFYFGDEVGRPGTLLTFFPWPGSRRGRKGNGEVTAVAFAVPERSLDYWRKRAAGHKLDVSAEESLLSFNDPDGMRVELVETPGDEPHEQAIRGLHSATLSLAGHEETAKLLTESFGWRMGSEEGNRFRLRAGSEGVGTAVDLLSGPALADGALGAGSVHHIAWRTSNQETQLAWRKHLTALGYDVTPVMDRQYFHSIYFREPGGVLFEIATDPPGFNWDEAPEDLGSGLKLPPWLEPRRAAIERALPPITLHKG